MVDIPKNADKIIQNADPGPPSATAVATPTIFPVPTWAATAVDKDWKGVILPSSTGFLLLYQLSFF